MLKRFENGNGGSWKIATHHSSLMPEKVPDSPQGKPMGTLKRQISPPSNMLNPEATPPAAKKSKIDVKSRSKSKA